MVQELVEWTIFYLETCLAISRAKKKAQARISERK